MFGELGERSGDQLADGLHAITTTVPDIRLQKPATMAASTAKPSCGPRCGGRGRCCA